MSAFHVRSLTIVLLALSAIPAIAHTVLYVDDDAPPDGDGLTWGTAHQYLQDALAAAGASGGQISEIRIARGTYRPDQGQSQTPGSRTATFQLMEDLCIKGGFAGLGAADPDQRDIRTFETVLNGADVSYHVVTGSGTDGTAILDGVVIQDGNADGASGYLNKGGGMLNIDGSPRIFNCYFRSNYAADRGGGMYNENYSEPKLVNTIFAGNYAKDGGAMYNYLLSNAVLINCTIAANTASRSAGGIHCVSSIPTIHNCILWYNHDDDGFMYQGSQISTDSMAVVSHSYIQGLTVYQFHSGNMGDPWSDPYLVGDDYRIHPSSPCVDRGDTRLLPPDASDLDGDGDTAEPIPLDLSGQNRVFNCRVDIGAYEAVTDLPSPIRSDFDGDCDVDAQDLQQFEVCGTGPAIPFTDPNCESTDLDMDTDIDQTDFGLFQGCYTSLDIPADPDCLPPAVPTLADYSYTGYGSSNCGPDHIELFPSRGTLRIIHNNGYTFNMCDGIWVWLSVDGRTLQLTERAAGGYCTGRVCFDVEAVVIGLKGHYTVRYDGMYGSHVQEVDVP